MPLDAAAIDAMYDFEAFERADIQPDDAATRLSHVLWHMAALEESVNRALHEDKRERVLDADTRNALHDVLRGHDTAVARIEAAYRRLADGGAGASDGEGVPA